MKTAMAHRLVSVAMLVPLLCAGCAVSQKTVATPAAAAAPVAYPSTYKALPSRTTVIRNATILTAAGPVIRNGSLLLRDGKVAAVGATVDAPADAQVIDANGKWVTPGIIDTHSHLGVY